MAHNFSTERYCAFCGSPLSSGTASNAGDLGSRPCAACGKFTYVGPRVLVLALLFAEGRLLLMRRGVAPYVGCWAPPGGFVEAGESPEAAVIRETAEEVGIVLQHEHLVPHAIISLPNINQVYVCFLGILDRLISPRPAPPEALDARWFTWPEYQRAQMWEPAAAFDIGNIFEQVATGRFYFYQRSGGVARAYGPYSVGRERPPDDGWW